MSVQAAFILTAVVIIVLYAIMTKTAKNVYRKTGVNTVGGVHKLLWYAEMFAIFCAFLLLSQGKTGLGIVLIIGSVLVFSALHFLLSIKAGVTDAVIMGILQGFTGPLTALLNCFVFTANIALKTNIKMLNMDAAADVQVRQNQAQKAFEAQATQNAANADRDARAEVAAQNAGFANADEAEDAGFDTGKNHK